ncbi:hypothetical protein FQA39_LY10900 [Lamprigera yunnana]|nr:hypothetical protein FQA39_LY10900 [Lamprigera yunnana]
MVAMNSVKRLIGAEGVTFENAFVNTPICCPSRSTILTGKYIHNIGVKNNSLSGNCSSKHWQKYHEPKSFPSLLKNANYTTFYAGKYLNTYGDEEIGGTKHVPKGYDWWIGLKGNSRYYNYTLSINGSAVKLSNQYLTDVMKMYALSFLNQQRLKKDHFFMALATPAAHEPFTPASRHSKKFPNVKVHRTPSFNYTDSKKHWLIRMPPKYLPTNVTILDNVQRQRLQTLLAVDELVFEIVHKLENIGVLKDTYIIFTSDNGYHVGQFVQPWDKRQPYETDIRVPFMVRGPLIHPNQTYMLPISAVDIAPTILDMAGVSIPHDIDGISLYKNMVKGTDSKYGDVLIEYYGEGDLKAVDDQCPWTNDDNLTVCEINTWCKCQDSRNNTYICIRRFSNTLNFKFCRFFDNNNFMEAYNLLSDPYELKNIYEEMDEDWVRENLHALDLLRNCIGRQCRSAFTLALCCGQDIMTEEDLALHITFDLLTNETTLRTRQHGLWGKEYIVQGIPFHYDKGFDLFLLCEPSAYKVFINTILYVDSMQNIGYREVTFMAVKGDVTVDKISFEASESSDSATDVNHKIQPVQYHVYHSVPCDSGPFNIQPGRDVRPLSWKVYVIYGVIALLVLVVLLCAVLVPKYGKKHEYDFD